MGAGGGAVFGGENCIGSLNCIGSGGGALNCIGSGGGALNCIGSGGGALNCIGLGGGLAGLGLCLGPQSSYMLSSSWTWAGPGLAKAGRTAGRIPGSDALERMDPAFGGHTGTETGA